MQSLEDLDNGSSLVLHESAKSDLSPEQKLSRAMIVLAVQDLNLENHFPELKRHFVVAKTKKIKRPNVISAIDYILSEGDQGALCYDNACMNLLIDRESLRNLLIKCIKENDGEVFEIYRSWRSV